MSKKTKKEVLDEILDSFYAFTKEQKLPYTEKIDSFRKEWDMKKICGLVETYIMPIYDQGQTELREYVIIELARLQMLALSQGLSDLKEFTPDEVLITTLIKFINDFIKVLKL